MTLKQFPWVYYMIICHVGPPWALFRGPHLVRSSFYPSGAGWKWVKNRKMGVFSLGCQWNILKMQWNNPYIYEKWYFEKNRPVTERSSWIWFRSSVTAWPFFATVLLLNEKPSTFILLLLSRHHWPPSWETTIFRVFIRQHLCLITCCCNCPMPTVQSQP